MSSVKFHTTIGTNTGDYTKNLLDCKSIH